MKEVALRNKKWMKIGLIVLIALGIASGWVYPKIANRTNSISTSDAMALQVGFIRQYGGEATIQEVVSPKIYAVAWTDEDGSNNVSMNVGGVWVLLATTTPVALVPSE